MFRDRVTDYKEIPGTTVRITKTTPVVGRMVGITDNSNKETLHRIKSTTLGAAN